VERKNREVEQARGALEEQATELALTSKYKSEFLANMSHELRRRSTRSCCWTAARRQPRRYADPRQVDSRGTSTRPAPIADAHHRHSRFVQDRVGTVTVDVADVTFTELRDSVQRTFHHVAESKV